MPYDSSFACNSIPLIVRQWPLLGKTVLLSSSTMVGVTRAYQFTSKYLF